MSALVILSFVLATKQIYVRDKLSGTKFSFPGIGNSREFSAIPGKFPGIAKSTKILGISRGWTMIYAFNWTNMKNTGDH